MIPLSVSRVSHEVTPLKNGKIWKTQVTDTAHSKTGWVGHLYPQSLGEVLFSQKAGDPAFPGADRWVSVTASHRVGNAL